MEPTNHDKSTDSLWWMVIRIGSGGSTKADAMPTVHFETMDEARAEAERLASIFPNHPRGFAVVEVKSVFRGCVDTVEICFWKKSNLTIAPGVFDAWKVVSEKFSEDSPLKYGWLQEGRFIKRFGNSILVEFPHSLEPQSHTLFWPHAVKKIEEKLTELLGTKIKFRFRFSSEAPIVSSKLESGDQNSIKRPTIKRGVTK